MFSAPVAGPSMTNDQSGVVTVPSAGSDVEAKDRGIAILKNVLLALDAHLAQGTRLQPPAGVAQPLPADHIGLDKASLEIAMDDTSGLRCTGAAPNRPGAALRLARGQERDQAEDLVRGPSQPSQARLLEPQRRQKLEA